MELREKILKAAAAVYAEVGFRGATTRRIAQEAGVNEITLFRQFGSKAALLHEAVHAAGLFPTAPVLPDEPGEPRGDLMVWALAHYDDLVTKRSLIRTCFGECEEHPSILPPADNAARRSTDTLERYLGVLQARGLVRQDLDVHAAAAMLTGVLFADAMGRDIIPSLFHNDAQTSIAQYLDLFLRGIRATEAL
jgi:AcrR family transcriptional regulator